MHLQSNRRVIQWALAHPKRVVQLMVASTLLLVALAVAPTFVPGGLGPLPTIVVDVDPENMLEADNPARTFHTASKARYGLHDAVVLGIVNNEHAQGIFNPGTLAKLHRLTEFARGLEGAVADDVLSLSTVDSIEHVGPGDVEFDWLMAKPPETEQEARTVQRRAERIPFLRDTLFSADLKAAVIYIPLKDKSYARDISIALQKEVGEIRKLLRERKLEPGHDDFHIAGLPVAEETFGVEMFIQMAISAPLAMLVIFLLMWLFFRRLVVITAPMIVAMVAVLTTMALLVISGNTIHIMSSMIPIFIMPIAVLDAVHIISDFFDRYDEKEDRVETVRSVMRHLFAPMFFTSLTTAAGFASLALTPIPPVRAFGIFVAVGVLLAWFWTIVFIPAYLVVLSPRRLVGFGRRAQGQSDGPATGFLGWLNRFTFRRAKLVVLGALVAVAGAGYGISKIQINDNPTRWFESDHPIRIADRELNAHFGGTYDAFLAFEYVPVAYAPATHNAELKKALTRQRAAVAKSLDELANKASSSTGEPLATVEKLEAELLLQRKQAVAASDRVAADAALDLLNEAFETLDAGQAPEAAAYPAQLAAQARARAAELDATLTGLEATFDSVAAGAPGSAKEFFEAVEKAMGDSASPVAAAFVGSQAQDTEVFKSPELLAYLSRFQAHLDANAAVGKSSSVADIVKTVYRDFVSGKDQDYRLPASSAVVAQILDRYLSSHRKDDLWHFVTPDFRHAVIWLQLTSGDNQQMEKVLASAQDFIDANPPPVTMKDPKWFGLTYINVVWQDKMVSGMLNAFLGSFVIVLLMMIFLFRSPLWGLLSMIPLTVTVVVIYGIIGLVGKDYDMPVAVLSSLSLGLAVDYAIHFLVRSRDLRTLHGSWDAARTLVFGEPARAISRNIVVVGVGFLPLLIAPLVPYQTVGVLIALILILAGGASLMILPALISLLEDYLFKRDSNLPLDTAEPSQDKPPGEVS